MSELERIFQLQRHAYLRQPVPVLARRRADLKQLRRFIVANQDAICEAIDQDFGHRSRHETLMSDIMPTLLGIDHALKNVAKWMRLQRREVDWRLFPGARNRVLPQPLGVVGIMVPWNFPLFLSLGPLTSALAAGNRAMVKMSEHSSSLAALLIDKMPLYFPPEKVQFFAETGDIGPAFTRLRWDHLFFTGSSRVGKVVMRAAAENLCPITLELGGKTPAVICPDFPVDVAAERIMFVKQLNAGQVCVSVNHVWIEQRSVQTFVSTAHTFAQRSYASLMSPDYTAIISRHAFERLVKALDEARSRGATVIALLDGPALDIENKKIAPHIVLNAPEDCALIQEEIFGPILPIRTYQSLDQVIESTNAGERPLAFYPFSHDRRTVQKLLAHVMSGGVGVNNALFHVAQNDLPFGGVGASGIGQSQGQAGFATFSKMRPVFYQSPLDTTWLFRPPYGRLIEGLLKFFTR